MGLILQVLSFVLFFKVNFFDEGTGKITIYCQECSKIEKKAHIGFNFNGLTFNKNVNCVLCFERLVSLYKKLFSLILNRKINQD